MYLQSLNTPIFIHRANLMESKEPKSMKKASEMPVNNEYTVLQKQSLMHTTDARQLVILAA